MKPKYRVMFDRSGEAIERIEPGSIFGWNPIEWFQINPDEQRLYRPLAMQRGRFSIGLRMGDALQYLTQVQTGRAPLAGVIIEITTGKGTRQQVNFRGVDVNSAEVTNGMGVVEFSYQLIRA